jgi:hypothetical protein
VAYLLILTRADFKDVKLRAVRPSYDAQVKLNIHKHLVSLFTSTKEMGVPVLACRKQNKVMLPLEVISRNLIETPPRVGQFQVNNACISGPCMRGPPRDQQFNMLLLFHDGCLRQGSQTSRSDDVVSIEGKIIPGSAPKVANYKTFCGYKNSVLCNF